MDFVHPEVTLLLAAVRITNVPSVLLGDFAPWDASCLSYAMLVATQPSVKVNARSVTTTHILRLLACLCANPAIPMQGITHWRVLLAVSRWITTPSSSNSRHLFLTSAVFSCFVAYSLIVKKISSAAAEVVCVLLFLAQGHVNRTI
jgi:hypothetical protein